MNREELIDHFRNTQVHIEHILQAQEIARDCLSYMNSFLKPGMDMETVHQECESYMKEKGAHSFWTHNDPALILFADLTSYSGHLAPAELIRDRRISENDLITIDVAPTVFNGWGDMARSFIMENGTIIDWKQSHNEEIREGMDMEMKLHELFIESVKDDTTFSDLYQITENYLKEHGYYNCDYHGNFGHTIENHPNDRVTIIKGVDIVISKYDKPVTFEPHICKVNGYYGVKHENMYVYHEGKMREI